MRRFSLVAPLWALTLATAFAADAVKQDVQVSATVVAADFRVDPVGRWPDKTSLVYLPELDDFREFSRDLEIRSNVGGVQVRLARDFRFVDENNTANDELDLFVAVFGSQGKGGMVPGDGTPLVLMEKSGWENFQALLWTERAIPKGQRLTAGNYSAELSLLFEVIAP